jgi:hypothetical protein
MKIYCSFASICVDYATDVLFSKLKIEISAFKRLPLNGNIKRNKPISIIWPLKKG